MNLLVAVISLLTTCTVILADDGLLRVTINSTVPLLSSTWYIN